MVKLFWSDQKFPIGALYMAYTRIIQSLQKQALK